MTSPSHRSTLETLRVELRRLAQEADLLQADVSVLAKPLTPEEAIGTPGRRDYPILVGKERVIEATVLGSRGHAFTDSARELKGTVTEVLELELDSNFDRAIFVATGNALLRHLGLAKGTVHCKDDDPERCGAQIADHILATYGQVTVGLIGLNPAIAERLVQVFGPGRVRLTDLNPDQVGTERWGVEIWHGRDRADQLIDEADVVVLTGTTLVNDTFDSLRARLEAAAKPYLVFGVTAAGVCALTAIERLCPCGRDG